MRELFDSVRRSFAFPPPASGDESPTGTLVGKINSRIRRSRAFTRSSRQLPPPSSSSASPTPPSPPTTHTHAAADTDTSGVDVPPPFRWRKGDLIGCGAFGRVYMGMNLDSGELLAVKEVLIAANHASREKAQAHIMELEKEVNLLKNLSHPNIVRYLGTVREENSLNILLEFVPGGSISSLLYKFGSFPDAVIKTYTKQLLLGLEYLHKSEIMHRDIKGANILVDNSGHIKLADFGASKKVVELATISGAKSMKGTPYWMAPEVILQTGHSFSADIWSVGCTVIEMATGKPPWSEQYHQEVSALFHIGTTKSHPPIPDHLSVVAKDFLLKCLHKEPNLRPTASELLQHPFVTGEQSRPMTSQAPLGDKDENLLKSGVNLESMRSYSPGKTEMTSGEREFVGMTRCPDDDDMCLIDDMHDFEGKYFPKSVCADDVNQSYNPMCEPSEDWGCHSVQSHGLPNVVLEEGLSSEILADEHLNSSPASSTLKNNNIIVSPLSCTSISEDDEELTELKIKVFLEEKAMELKKLQTPLYEEFYNTINGSCSPLPNLIERFHDENGSNFLKLPPKSKSPSRASPSKSGGGGDTVSPNKFVPNIISQQTSSPPPDPTPNQCKESRGFQSDATSPRMSFLEIQKKWKEELDQELQRQRERMRLAGVVGKTSSPNDRGGALHRPKERCQIASPGR